MERVQKRHIQITNGMKKKGMVAIYLLIFSMVMISVVVPLISSADNEIEYMRYYSKYILEEHIGERGREEYLSRLNGYLGEHFEEVKEAGIKQFLKDNREVLFSKMAEDSGVTVVYSIGEDWFNLNVDYKRRVNDYRITPQIAEEEIVYKIKRIEN